MTTDPTVPQPLESQQFLTLTDPEGRQLFEIEALSGREAVSELFEFQLDLIAPTSNDDYSGITGREAVIRWRFSNDSVRTVRGMLRRFVRLRSDNRSDRFAATFVPTIWTATQHRTCGVYQKMTAPEIIRNLLRGSVEEYRWRTPSKIYDTRVTCVQYMESNFDFAQRLMAEEGIHYYFDHAAQSRLVIGDNSSSNPLLAEPSKLRFSEVHGQTPEDGRVFSLQMFEQMTVPDVRLLDHAFERESARIDATTATFPGNPSRGGIPPNEWRGFNESYGAIAHRFDEYDSKGSRNQKTLDGVGKAVEAAAKLRAELHAAQYSRTVAESDYLHLAPGYRFELVDAGAADNGIYLITSVEHRYRRDDQGRWICSNRFECLRADVPYRPRQTTPRLAIRGTQSAVVVGPKDERIFTDRYGRVRIRFHWQNADDDNACWVRVAQPWAGNNHGVLFTPRVGHEVLVGFLNGDPDQPAIVGSLHNAAHPPPYTPAADPGVTGYVSNSVSKEEASAHSSHLLFVDMPGKEQLHLHSERHAHLDVEHGMVQLIGWGEAGGGSQTFAGSASAGSTSAFDKVKGAIFGSNQWQAGVTQKVKGVQRYSVWGNEIDVTLGTSSQFVIGGWSQARIGAGVGLDVGFRTDIDVGMKVDLNIAPRIVINVGNQYDRTYGSRFVKTGKDFINHIGDDYVEKVSGKLRLATCNGTAVERLVVGSGGAELTYDVSSFKVHTGQPMPDSPDAKLYSEFREQFKLFAEKLEKPFEENPDYVNNPLYVDDPLAKEGRRQYALLDDLERLESKLKPLRVKYGINLISAFGNGEIVGMGEGNSVTLFARKINIVGHRIRVSSRKRQEFEKKEYDLEYEAVKQAILRNNTACNTALPALSYAAAKAKVETRTASCYASAAIVATGIAASEIILISRIFAALSANPNQWGL